MLNWFRARSAKARKAKQLYGAVVAAARHPEFYRDYGVPDTLNGRYELVVLVLFQLLQRLRTEGQAAEEQSRLTLEAFFTDMDDCLREIGVGDLAVPKKVKKAAAGFYERARVYRTALEAGDRQAMAAALQRFIDAQDVIEPDGTKAGAQSPAPSTRAGSHTAGDAFSALAAHAFRQRDALAAADAEAVLDGRAFLAPEKI
jgi:cytochrome b pre-mRNA-processing protein 3